MSKPIIAIAGQVEVSPDAFAIKRRYVSYLQSEGANCFMIPPSASAEDIEQLLFDADGLLLPGGGNVDPSAYNEAINDPSQEVVSERDVFETMLINWAIERNVPLYGLCRGLQIANVALGGSLSQEIESSLQHWQEDSATQAVHTVEVLEGTLLSQILGAGKLPVNSVHHQAVRELAPILVACAVAEDGLVEAAYIPTQKFFLAVQWHPEFMPVDAASRKMLQAFLRACT